MLVICLVLLLIVLVLVILSWRAMIKRLGPVELAASIMFGSLMLQQLSYMLDYNLNLKDLSAEPWEMVALRMNQALLFPIMMTWCSTFTAVGVNWTNRVLIYLAGAASISLVMFFFKSMGFVHYTGWKGIYNFVQFILFIPLNDLFLTFFRTYALGRSGGAK